MDQDDLDDIDDPEALAAAEATVNDLEPVQFLSGTIESMPSEGWVVHEIIQRRQGQQTMWAWCRVNVAEAGYTEVSYTLSDGVTAANPGDGTVLLGAVITKLWC